MRSRDVVRLVGWTTAYVGAGYLGRWTIIDGGALSLVWPAAGVAMLWFATSRRRTLLADALALGAATFAVNVTTGAPFALGAVFVLSNLLQVCGFLLVGRRLVPEVWGFGGRRAPSGLADLGRIVVAALLACFAAALVGLIGLQLVAGTGDGGPGFLVWWGRNTVGLVVVGLVGLLAVPSLHLADGARRSLRSSLRMLLPRSVPRALEALLLVAGTFAVYVAVFDFGDARPLAFLLLVPTFWAGIRFSPLAVTLHSLACGGGAVLFTLLGDGPFTAFSELSWRALVAQLFVVMIMVAGLSLAFSHAQERQAVVEVKSLMDGSRLASIVSTDLEGVIRMFGTGSERLLDYRAADVVGQHSRELFHDPEEVRSVAEELGVAAEDVFAELALREDDSRVWTYVRRDGTRLSVRLALTAIRDADGQVTGYLGVAIDTTQAIQSRRELVAANARWEVLTSNLPEMTILTISEDLTIGTVSGAGAAATGLAGAEGGPLAAVSAPGNVPVMADAIGRALEGEVVTVDLETTASGHQHEVAVTGLPGSAPREVLMVARDVSRDRARQRAVAAARDRAERLFVDAPQGIALLTVEGVLLQLNPALCDLLSRPEHELVGSALAGFSLAPADSTIAEHLRTVVEHPAARAETTWTLHDSDGAARTVSLSSTLLRDADGPGNDAVLTNVLDISERERHQQRLAHLADHDPLTGLANRRGFEARLRQHLDHCHRYGPRGALLMLDLDHFKDVNDTLGHAAGDELLVSLAGLLRHRLREADVVARLGGDEFAILLTEADHAAAERVAAEVVETVREHVSALDGTRRRVTASVGGVLVDGSGADDLLSRADLMLYDAKGAGRNRHAVLDPASSSTSSS